MRHARLAFAVVIALLLLAGCGVTPTSTGAPASAVSPTTSARVQVCQRLASVNESLTQLAQVGDKTTVGQVKPIQQKLTVALDALAKLPNGGGARLNDLQAANDELAAMIKDQPDSATIGEISPRLQDLKDKVAKAQAAEAKLASALNCKL